ncbi:MAG: hypothetical protein ACJ8CX_18655 [Microvirga sp.]
MRADSLAGWPGKGLVGTLLLLAAAVVAAGLASAFGIAHDYGYLHASRIDSTREKLERQLMDFANSELRPSAVRPRADPVLAAPDRNTAERVRDELAALRARCQRQVASMVTPMGDEMFYRYQEFRIDEALQMVATLLAGGPAGATSSSMSAMAHIKDHHHPAPAWNVLMKRTALLIHPSCRPDDRGRILLLRNVAQSIKRACGSSINPANRGRTAKSSLPIACGSSGDRR